MDEQNKTQPPPVLAPVKQLPEEHPEAPGSAASEEAGNKSHLSISMNKEKVFQTIHAIAEKTKKIKGEKINHTEKNCKTVKTS